MPFRVLHPEHVVPAEPRDDLLDLVDVHQMRPVDAPEHVRVEAGLQLVERPIVGRAGHLGGRYHILYPRPPTRGSHPRPGRAGTGRRP
ncbi:MAG: hypothetical protein MZV64_42510 [Ignavibacteriales bacterium]|nr:hypothetical protein [Ignavibacteriales bacterium]